MSTVEEQKERLRLANVEVPNFSWYCDRPDVLEETVADDAIPPGYKRCGGCKKVMKFHMFNKNRSARTYCTGNCKVCQKGAARKSYEKNKKKRDYKKYYAENRDYKREQHRKYYEKHKETILKKQKEYHKSKKGKEVMKRAHEKRRRLIADNKGIPYQREWVIARDTFNNVPHCYICNKPINSERDLQLDHVIPIVLGGNDCFTNVACTHTLCNLRREKDARNLEVEQVESIIDRAETYISEHPEYFENLE